MDPDLLRQRRNLITVSAVMLLFDFADVKVTKVGVLGTDLLVGDVGVLMVAAWLMWLYFFLRYYQYWRAAEGEVVRKGFRNAEYRRSLKATKRKAAREHKRIEIQSVNGVKHWQYYEPKKGSKPGEISMQLAQDVPVPPLAKWRWKFQAAIDVSLHTTSVTDLILPFVLAIAAPVVTISSHWGPVSAWIQQWLVAH